MKRGIDYKMGKMQSVKVDEEVTLLGGIQVHLQPFPFVIFDAYNVLHLPEGRDLENEIINLKIKLC